MIHGFFIFKHCLSSSYFNIDWTLLSICWVLWFAFGHGNMKDSFENTLIPFLENSQCSWGGRQETNNNNAMQKPV